MMASAFTRASAGLLFCVAAAASVPAHAQNFDSAGLLRFGAFGQGSWTSFDIQEPAGLGSPTSDGIGGGMSFGYDLLMPSGWLIGLEIDGSAEDSRTGDSRAGQEHDLAVNYLATLRGRVGSYLRPDLLIYATGGLALLGVEHHGPFDIAAGERLKTQRTLVGWTIGAGTEVEWYDTIFFAEYLFASYGDFQFTEPNLDRTRFEASVDQEHVLRLGV